MRACLDRCAGVTGSDDLTASRSTRPPSKHWPLPELVAGCAAAGRRRVGLWREPVPSTALDAAGGRWSAPPGWRSRTPVPGRLLHGDGRRTGHRRQPPRHRRGGGARAPTCWCWSAAACRPASRDLARRPRARRRRDRPRSCPYAAAAGVRLAIEPLHPMFCRRPLRRLHPRPGARPRRAASRPTRSASWSTPTTCGGTTRRRTRSPGPGDRIASFQLADWITPLPAGVLIGRGLPGDGCVDLRRLGARSTAAGYTGADRGRDLQRRPVGPPRPRRAPPRRSPPTTRSAEPARSHSPVRIRCIPAIPTGERDLAEGPRGRVEGAGVGRYPASVTGHVFISFDRGAALAYTDGLRGISVMPGCPSGTTGRPAASSAGPRWWPRSRPAPRSWW